MWRLTAAAAAGLMVLAACSNGGTDSSSSSTDSSASQESSSTSSSADESTSSGESSSEETSSEPAAPTEQISLRAITWTSNPDQLAVLQGISDEFRAEHPEVSEIQWETVPFPDLATVLTTQLSSQNPPDLSWLGIQLSRQFIDAGVLVDLAPTLKATDGYNFDDLIPKLQADWSDGDALYGVPMSTSGRALYYNADLFKAAGQPTPDEMIAAGTYDWQHLSEALKAITDQENLPGWAIAPDGKIDWTMLVPVWYAYGASPWNDDSTVCTMDSPEMVDAMSLVHKMLYDDKTASIPGQAANFWGGQAAVTSTYISSAKLLKDADFKWGLVPTPAGPAGDLQQVGQTSWVAYNAAPHADIAAQFVAKLTEVDSQTKLAQFFAPTRASLLNAATLHQAIPSLTEEQLQPIVDATRENGTVAPVATNAAQAEAALDSALDEFFFQPGIDVSQAMTAVCGALNPALVSG